MSGQPSTGAPSTYEAGDQQNYGREDITKEQKNHFIQRHVAERYKTDPTFAATMHGNQPSKGAMVDAQIQAEEAGFLKRKQEKTDSLPGKKFPGMPGTGE
ncbi:hypothetical protein F4775DRAFT_603033 [Biscogniauxia sp. FL1348]|nr:hypothetical protein F4775DRAFT_603033 [Biscogniauxia sp. FL1348]